MDRFFAVIPEDDPWWQEPPTVIKGTTEELLAARARAWARDYPGVEMSPLAPDYSEFITDDDYTHVHDGVYIHPVFHDKRSYCQPWSTKFDKTRLSVMESHACALYMEHAGLCPTADEFYAIAAEKL